MAKQLTKAEMEDRLLRALEMRGSGMTFKDIGIKLGRYDDPSLPIGKQQASQLIGMAIKFLRHPKRSNHPLRPLAEKLAEELRR
jgi:hypothetical protein